MRILAAEIRIDGCLRRGVVVDYAPDGRILSATALADLPSETAGTVYWGTPLVAEGGYLLPPLPLV